MSLILCARSAEIAGAGFGPVTEGILALHTLWRRLRDAGRSQGLYVSAGAAVCQSAVFLLIVWCCTGGEFFFGRPSERIRALVEGAKSLLLDPSGTEGAFRTLFLCVHSPILPLGVAPDSASLGHRDKEKLYLKNDCCPPPFRGVRREQGCDTSEPVAASSPLSAPASGSTGGRTPLIPAGGITRHRRHHAAAEFSGGVGSCCWVIDQVTGIVSILHSY